MGLQLWPPPSAWFPKLGVRTLCGGSYDKGVKFPSAYSAYIPIMVFHQVPFFCWGDKKGPEPRRDLGMAVPSHSAELLQLSHGFKMSTGCPKRMSQKDVPIGCPQYKRNSQELTGTHRNS